jgi:hypothetical protein
MFSSIAVEVTKAKLLYYASRLKNTVILVRERTITTERPSIVG